ncbi:PfkB family carbohydrate kinase [Sinorhizobium terangae]|uniref:PfkB family carbohydrate kinase n=1 Tax=Sinorhizobium terangae TaxID=110322 RepID=UPI0012970A06
MRTRNLPIWCGRQRRGPRSSVSKAGKGTVHPYLDALSSCSLVVVKQDEAEALGNWLRCETCEPTVEDLSRRLQTGVVRTLSGNGAEAFADGEKISVAAIKVDVKDTTAAGDCFVAR